SLVSDLCEALQCIMPDSQDEEAELSYSDAVRELHYVTNDAESIAQLRTLFEMHEIDFSIEDVEGDKKMFRIPATRQAYALYMLKTRIFDELIEKLSSYPTQLGCADQVDLESNKEAYALRYLSSDPDFIVKASELLDQHGIGSVRGVDQKTGQDILEIRLFGEIHKFYKLLASLDVDSSAEAAVRPAEIQALVAGGMLAAPAAAAAPAGEAAAPAPAAPGPA
ncbi:MAG: hypothetical protein K0U29_08580, partial [Gammaproteobacteria bacterium]|nr:hypothetical protein [Gammaproteobacteria bacterium]